MGFLAALVPTAGVTAGDGGPVGISNSEWARLWPWKEELPKTQDLGRGVKEPTSETQ